MNFKLQVILLSLLNKAVLTQVGYSSNQQQLTSTINIGGYRNPEIINIAIIVFGIVLIIVELLVWRKHKKQQSMISFSVFTKSDPVEIISSYDQSHNDFGSAKNEVNNEPEGDAENESPGIKTIKAMTQNKQNGGVEGERQSERRRRKRKADKLSDRRSKDKEES